MEDAYMAPVLKMEGECGRYLDELLIQYCSPTLAGIKNSNMFSAAVMEQSCIDRCLKYGNGRLNHKGVYLRCLRFRKGNALILVYRKRALEKSLKDPEVRAFLLKEGYGALADVDECLDVLGNRMMTDVFPHEIGVFLGYPLEDVKGFIENGGEKPLLVKYWKVYSDVENTRSWFDRMDRVCMVYKKSYMSGNSIDRLTVCRKGA